MDKMKTFTIYVLLIIGFFVFSELASGQLLKQLYKNLSGSTESNLSYNGENLDVDTEVIDAKATRMNGYITVRVKNNTNQTIDKAYLRLDLFAKGNIKAITRYMDITDLKPGESKDYTLKFRAGYVDSYKVAIERDYPDKDYVFEMFGYEIIII